VGAGGSTDVVMRAVTPHAEEVLGARVVLTNRTGGVGAIATEFVQVQDADGCTLLMGAENPQIYKVMGLGHIDYGDFVPISVLARGVPLIVANTDAPFNTFQELVDYVQAHPGEVKIGSTGRTRRCPSARAQRRAWSRPKAPTTRRWAAPSFRC